VSEQLRLWDGLPRTFIEQRPPMTRPTLGKPFDPDAAKHPDADVIPLWLVRQRRGVKSSTGTLNSTERRA